MAVWKSNLEAPQRLKSCRSTSFIECLKRPACRRRCRSAAKVGRIAAVLGCCGCAAVGGMRYGLGAPRLRSAAQPLLDQVADGLAKLAPEQPAPALAIRAAALRASSALVAAEESAERAVRPEQALAHLFAARHRQPQDCRGCPASPDRSAAPSHGPLDHHGIAEADRIGAVRPGPRSSCTSCGSTRKPIILVLRSTVPTPVIFTSGPTKGGSVVTALPLSILKRRRELAEIGRQRLALLPARQRACSPGADHLRDVEAADLAVLEIHGEVVPREVADRSRVTVELGERSEIILPQLVESPKHGC